MTPARMGGRARPAESAADDHQPSVASDKTIWVLGPVEDPLDEYERRIEQALAAELGAIVIVPEVGEGSRILDHLDKRFPHDAALVHSAIEEPQRSNHLWDVALGKRRVVLGGRASIFAPAFPLGTIIVHDEHDRSLKEQRSPYYDARVIAELRAHQTGSDLLMTSSSPSVAWWHPESSASWKRIEPDRATVRSRWPIVEVVEPPSGGARGARLPRRVIAAIIEARGKRAKSVVLVPRVSGIEGISDYLRRVVPSASISTITSGEKERGSEKTETLERALASDVIVATTAVLKDIERPPIGCAIVLGLDAVLARPYGRAVEDETQELWDLAGWLARSGPTAGERGRMLIETKAGDHHCLQGLVRGDYRFFATRELERRSQDQSPPLVSLIRLRGDIGEETAEELRKLPGVLEVMGPAPGGDEDARPIVLIKVADLEAVLDPLREKLWSADVAILVEVDPKVW